MVSYQSLYQEAKASYDQLEIVNIDSLINTLDEAIVRSNDAKDSTGTQVENAFMPINEYYTQLSDVNTKLQACLDKAGHTISDSQGTLLNEERYENKIHPEETVHAREIMFGIVPSLRPRSIPYIMSAAVAMTCLTIFIIFQMNGMSGQVNLPPAVVTWWSSPSTFTFRDPMILSGLVIVLLAAVVIFAVLYYRAKNTNKG